MQSCSLGLPVGILGNEQKHDDDDEVDKPYLRNTSYRKGQLQYFIPTLLHYTDCLRLAMCKSVKMC